MNDTETHSPAQSQSPDLEWQVAALQRQVFLLLLALVVISATVVFYLYCQARFLSKDLEAFRPQAMQIITNYKQGELGLKNFRAQLSNYANTHPTFQPVLAKYGWRPATNAPKQ